uniref:Transcription factor AP-2 C-terminal domain-containing protein n=1 Tax=Acrobeloides nanus TaxID=290746 RepID=A0A914DQ07_9BILA
MAQPNWMMMPQMFAVVPGSTASLNSNPFVSVEAPRTFVETNGNKRSSSTDLKENKTKRVKLDKDPQEHSDISSDDESTDDDEGHKTPPQHQQQQLQVASLTPMGNPLAHSTPVVGSAFYSNPNVAWNTNPQHQMMAQYFGYGFNDTYNNQLMGSPYAAYYANPMLRSTMHPQPAFGPIKTDSGIASSNNSSTDDSSAPTTDMGLLSTPVFSMPNAAKLNMFEPFCTVPGRLTLLSNTKKYRVTLGEVQRRISPPECLNASILGGILRKAKNKDGGKALRDHLKQHGITLPSGRRKSTPTTVFTALVEEEAIQIARDLDDINKRHYPMSQFVMYLMRDIKNEEQAQDNCLMLYYARRFLKKLIDFHQDDRSPIGDQRVEMVHDPDIQKGLTHYSMITHGFGGLNMNSVLDIESKCIMESIKALQEQFPQMQNRVLNNWNGYPAEAMPGSSTS